MHAPHTRERYVDLFNAALQLQTPLRVSNVHMLMLGSVYPDNVDRPEEGLHGEIYRFVKLDPNEPWLNTQTHDVATSEELREVNIPGHLLPHLQSFSFVFRPETHHLYYIRKDRTDSMGPMYVQNLLQHLFNQLTNSREFPEVSVTVIPSLDSIDRIFEMPTIENLIIEMRRPNPDDGQTDQERWEEKLRRQGVKKMAVSLHASHGETINADEDTLTMARVAAINGRVLAVGRDAAGNKMEESTVERNLIEYVPVDSNLETAQHALRRTALTLDSSIAQLGAV